MSALPERLFPLTRDPGHSALLLDFDGTLSAIVGDPEAARPQPGVSALLARLAGQFSLVAVVSGRPVRFLAHVLGPPAGVRVIGLYGLEALAPDGTVRVIDEAAPWEMVVAEVARLAATQAPVGVLVEPKGMTLTLHWRHAPRAQGWVEAFAAGQVAAHGLVSTSARMSIELGPPLRVDKGTVARSLTEGADFHAVAVFGDDLGDLPAFAAASAEHVIRVAAVDEESPPEVAAQADLTVNGAAGAVALLQLLADTVESGDLAASGGGAGG